jgi:hypothetical protein
MAFANSAITDIIATTIQSRSGVLADNRARKLCTTIQILITLIHIAVMKY